MPPRPDSPPRSAWSALLELAIAEDVGSGDVTCEAIFAPDDRTRAALEARQDLVVCGIDVAHAAFEALEPKLHFVPLCEDGATIRAGSELAQIEGCTRGVLAAERTAVNFLQRLCGVASWTARFVAAVAGTNARIVDTRKTLPGWRVLDKYAVACGGGTNHRFGLFDGVLIKDNHVAAAGGTALAVKAAREAARPGLEIQVEVESLEDAFAAVDAGADLLLLDNRSVPELREYVSALGDRIPLEATGGVTLATVREIAETGVHRISIGALTHSAPSADVALEVRGDGPGPGPV